MVVALNLEGQTVAIPQIHHAGVLTRPHQNPRSFRREAAEQRA